MLGLDVPIAVVDAGDAAAVVRTRVAGGAARPCRSPPSPASRTPPARRRRSPRSTAPSPTCSPAAPPAVVTNPVAKNVLYRPGFADPGHTEFLARLAVEATGQPARPVMMLWSPELAVVPVTIHLPLREVPAQLTRDLIVETGRIVARDLAARFGIARPRLAVAGLNPHAGEDGALGEEDRAIVRAGGRAAAAPTASTRAGRCRPTRMFHAAARADLRRGALHVSRPGADPDQDAGVRPRASTSRSACRSCAPRPITAPPSTSPAPGAADPSSLIAALRLAARLAARRAGAGCRANDARRSTTCRRCARSSAGTACRAKKSLGQNFLLDLNLTGRIARAAGPLDGVTVVEIGPGPGGLTRALLARRRRAASSRSSATSAPRRARARSPRAIRAGSTIVAGDALEFDARAHLGRRPRAHRRQPALQHRHRAAGRLARPPSRGRPGTTALVLMFQREVAERIVAAPGSKTYGRLSVLAGWRTRGRRSCSTSRRRAFVPPPKVTSVGGASSYRAPQPAALRSRARCERVTAAAFGQRRKMLRQSLKHARRRSAAAARSGRPRRRPRAPRTFRSRAFVALAHARWQSRHKMPRMTKLRR